MPPGADRLRPIAAARRSWKPTGKQRPASARRWNRPLPKLTAAPPPRTASAERVGRADRQSGSAALPYPQRKDAQAALDKLEADRCTLRTGWETAQRRLKQAEQTVAAAEAAVEALTAQQTAAQKELPARSAEELTAQQIELTAARESLRAGKSVSAQLRPIRKNSGA